MRVGVERELHRLELRRLCVERLREKQQILHVPHFLAHARYAVDPVVHREIVFQNSFLIIEECCAIGECIVPFRRLIRRHRKRRHQHEFIAEHRPRRFGQDLHAFFRIGCGVMIVQFAIHSVDTLFQVVEELFGPVANVFGQNNDLLLFVVGCDFLQIEIADRQQSIELVDQRLQCCGVRLLQVLRSVLPRAKCRFFRLNEYQQLR